MERLKKALFIAASSLLFCFPVYADEPEAADLPIEEVNHDIELINDSTKEASEVPIDNLAEIQGGMLRSPSVNPDAEFSYYGYEVVTGDGENRVGLSLLYTGTINSYDFCLQGTDGIAHITTGLNSDGIRYFNSPFTLLYIELNGTQYNYNTYISAENIGDVEADNLSMSIYLDNVGYIFTWLLTTIGTLITFILGNPFLAVSLLLFMAGVVISFYARIKNS